MATTTHPNNFTVTLSIGERGATSNSVQLGGWSDAGAVITFPDIEPDANIRQGIDGDLQGTLRSGFGGDVSFEFMSDSPSVQWFQGRLAQLHNEESVTIQGVVVNSTTGETCSLVDCSAWCDPSPTSAAMDHRRWSSPCASRISSRTTRASARR